MFAKVARFAQLLECRLSGSRQRSICGISTQVSLRKSTDPPPNIEYVGDWPTTDKDAFAHDMTLIENFITAVDEASFMKELEPYLKRMKYEFDHWDDAIHGFRETERKQWYPDNKTVIERIREIAFKGEIQPYVHVLDLAKEGFIKPHVDSVRYCGSTIAGISLLSDCVMRLVRVDETSASDNSEFRTSQLKFKDYHANVLLPRHSLYVMRNSARYNYTHEILDNKESMIYGRAVEKDRRVSIICRNEPKAS